MNSNRTVELRRETRKFYNKVRRVICPVLNNTPIIFNSIGFRHLIYKPDGTPRSSAEVVYKLTLLPLAIPVIQYAKGIDEIRDTTFRYKRGKKTYYKEAKAYALITKVGKKGIKVKVIILHVGSGNYIFYSIMKIK